MQPITTDTCARRTTNRPPVQRADGGYDWCRDLCSAGSCVRFYLRVRHERLQRGIDPPSAFRCHSRASGVWLGLFTQSSTHARAGDRRSAQAPGTTRPAVPCLLDRLLAPSRRIDQVLLIDRRGQRAHHIAVTKAASSGRNRRVNSRRNHGPERHASGP